MDKKEKYKWANHIKSLSVENRKALIEGLKGTIALNLPTVDNVALRGQLKFAEGL